MNEQINFLIEVLQTTANSKGNPEVVYQLLGANLDKLDENFADILRSWGTENLSELKPKDAQINAGIIFNLSNLVRKFPLGNRANNIEIAITGYEVVLIVRTEKDFPYDWAITQNSLGNAYRDRIKGNKAENLELAIVRYKLALSVHNKKDFPYDWAMNQNSLGNAYLFRIKEDKPNNLELAIAAFQSALLVYTKEDFPYPWAIAQSNLGNTYSERIKEDRADNLELAIAAYQRSLEVFTKKDYPTQWATTQNGLGSAYLNRIKGDTKQNLENAIAAFELALSVHTKQNFPYNWAMTQNNLGSAYRCRIEGDRLKNMENSITAHQSALEIYTKKDFPYYWAMTQNNLAAAYGNRIKEDKAENLESAINALKKALSVYTEKDFPYDWATTQNNLGNAYCNRIEKDKSENLESAIAAYQRSLEVFTEKTFRHDWATTQNNLGNVYLSTRITGDRNKNLELAITKFQLALSVHTKQDFPYNWARTQNNLGNAYCEKTTDKSENLKNAITAYQQALEVYTKQYFPIDWATTQNNLGTAYAAYAETIGDNKAENLENAIAAFEQALEVRTLNANPIEHLTTSRNLGNLHFNEGNWKPAIPAYEKAITAVELSRSWSKDDDRRQQILAESIDVYQNIIQCFINLKQYEKAVEYAERSRSRMVAELMASKDLYPNAEIPQHLLEEYYHLQKLLSDLHRSNSVGTFHGTSLPITDSRFEHRNSGKVEKQRLAEIEKIEAKRQKVWREIRSSDPVLAGQLQVDPLSIEQMQALIKDKETAILSFYTTDDDTHIFIVRQQDIQLFTCEGQGIEKLQNWIGQNWLKLYVENRAEWRKNMGEFLQQLAQRLQLNQLIAQHLTDIKELIIVPHLFLHQIPFAALPVDIPPTTVGGEIPPTPLGKGGYEDSVSLGKGGYLDTASPLKRRTQGGSTTVKNEEIPPTPLGKGGYEDSVSLGKGSYLDPASPFQRGTGGGFYREFADTRLSIPTGKKTTPPTGKPKTPETQPTYLSDKFRLRVVPSCQILSYCDNRNKTTDSPKMGIVENATGDLRGSEYECQNLAQMFQVPNNLHLKYQEATVNNYRQLAKQVQILHSSHHASADLINPLESKLKLFDGEVTLGDVFTWRLPELTDVFLSCCETNLTFINKLNDDILTIAAGFLSAGAQSVVSTLWAVEDRSTAEFCQLYYQFRNQGETRPEALRKAQFELRKRENFKHPYYWAGFVSQGLQ
ncbi:CHAT domain-containing protein [Dapis sp. BLCC M229]|uniref:CHAT domain-containing protein n=1 Tax=Dapis sp. BLCC M229 TaxID=3400188 RepID=UPI003CF063E9